MRPKWLHVLELAECLLIGAAVVALTASLWPYSLVSGVAAVVLWAAWIDVKERSRFRYGVTVMIREYRDANPHLRNRANHAEDPGLW